MHDDQIWYVVTISSGLKIVLDRCGVKKKKTSATRPIVQFSGVRTVVPPILIARSRVIPVCTLCSQRRRLRREVVGQEMVPARGGF
jgi:hypothetical protein